MAPHPQNIGVEATTLQDTFTPEELARLVALRESVAHRSIYYELGLDENRLTFARWLYEHGRLSETIPTRGVPQASKAS